MVSQNQLTYLKAMGIDAWQTRSSVEAIITVESEVELQSAVQSIVPASSNATEAIKDDVATLDWQTLQQRIANCRACGLHTSRIQTVFGVGNPQADLLIIGEAPGANEDKQGEPFVGRAGQLLNSMLAAIGLQREDVFIANILKCRPPQNRDPKPEETTKCTPYLDRQVALLQPKLIMAVGRIASHYLLQCSTPMGRLRGQRYQFRDTGIPLIVSYHPAYLLRSPQEKRKAYEDLILAKNLIAEVTEAGLTINAKASQ